MYNLKIHLTFEADILLSFLASINIISGSFVKFSSDRTFVTLLNSLSEKNNITLNALEVSEAAL